MTNAEDVRLNDELAARERRDAILREIQLTRDLLFPAPARKGEPYQGYRDSWSRLCRRLCDERGKAVLRVIAGGCSSPRSSTFDGVA